MIPVIVSNEQVCGHNRIVIGLIDPDNRPIGAPDRSLRVAFYDLAHDPNTPVSSTDGTFVWAIEGAVGVYIVQADFSEAGVWGAEFTSTARGGEPEVVRQTFDVIPTGTTVAVGDHAPATTNPILADVGGDVAKISTDAAPDPRLYQTSVDRALQDGKPFVLVFATPKFCRSGQCGPTLDRVKPFLDRYPGVTFINVEPYELVAQGGQLQPVRAENGEPKPVPATEAWRITSEPWVFVVDRSGVIRGSFEGIFGDAELAAALDEVK
jgi:hypothetical protein